MTGLRYSPLHVTELCEEMQGNFKVGCARLINMAVLNCIGIKSSHIPFAFTTGNLIGF